MRLKNKISLRTVSPLLAHFLCLTDIALLVLLVPLLVWAFDVNRGDHYQALMILAGAYSFVFFHGTGLYQPRRGQFLFIEFLTILKAWGMVVGVVLLTLFAFKVAQLYSRAVLLTWFCLTPLALYFLHAVFRKILRAIRSKGRNLRSAVIVGAQEMGVTLAGYLERLSWTGIRVQGFFDDHRNVADLPPGSPPVLGPVDGLKDYLITRGADCVFLALPLSEENKITKILQQCRTHGAQIYLVPDLYAFYLYNAQVETLGDILLLNFNPELRAKRAFDIVFSLILLLASAPLCLFIALLIKLQDKGPILYRQKRISLAGKSFECLKFRTMCPDADAKLQNILKNDAKMQQEWETTFKLKKDPRVTPLGRLLRRTSMDELPQFLNVLKGEMSVVGARPIVDNELNGVYNQNGGIYCSMKPGITGYWQVSGRSDTVDYNRRIAMDTWYAQNQSLWIDIKIITKTILMVITGKGAY